MEVQTQPQVYPFNPSWCAAHVVAPLAPKKPGQVKERVAAKFCKTWKPSRLSTVQKMKVDLENPDSTGHGDIFSEVQHPFLKQAAMRGKVRRLKDNASIQLAPPGGG